MKFIATIEMKVEIKAIDKKFAKKLVKNYKPFIKTHGCGIDVGGYSVESLDDLEIKDIVEVK